VRIDDLKRQFVAVDGFSQQSERATGGHQRGRDADVDFGLGKIGHNVRPRAAANHSDVERGAAEQGMSEVGELCAEVAVDPVECAGELENRVFSALRHRAVRGAAAGAQSGPQRAFGGVDDVHRGRLADDREDILMRMVFGEIPRSPLSGFLAHETHEIHRHGQIGEKLAIFMQRPQHGGHRALGVARAAAPQAAVADLPAEGIDGHAADAHGIEVRT